MNNLVQLSSNELENVVGGSEFVFESDKSKKTGVWETNKNLLKDIFWCDKAETEGTGYFKNKFDRIKKDFGNGTTLAKTAVVSEGVAGVMGTAAAVGGVAALTVYGVKKIKNRFGK